MSQMDLGMQTFVLKQHSYKKAWFLLLILFFHAFYYYVTIHNIFLLYYNPLT